MSSEEQEKENKNSKIIKAGSDQRLLQDKDQDSRERRITHRLITARWVIWGGASAVAMLTISSFYLFDEKTAGEILRDTISLLGTIVTLALGFIAGSNIE